MKLPRSARIRLLLPTVTAFVCGLAFGDFRAQATPVASNPYQAIAQLGRVLVEVENQHVDPVDRAKLIEGAIKGMVENLDPHSSYLSPEEWKQFQSDTEGKFVGVGLEVDGRFDRLIVIAPIEGSPAARAGIQSGDQILGVDAEDVAAQPLEKVVKKMRGLAGTKVKVTVRRDGTSRPLDTMAPVTSKVLTFELTREAIHVASVRYKLLDGDIGYLRIRQFQEQAHTEFVNAVASLRAEAKGKPLAGLVLDVRSNPGGLVDEATEIADEFLASGSIYSMRHRGQVIEALQARGGGALLDIPCVALVNEWSASASELLVGALQDNHRVRVVGANTFGKGSVQSLLALPNGAGLKLTTARYYTPSGHAIQADGIHPDVIVQATENKDAPKIVRERDLPGHLVAEGSQSSGQKGAVVVDGGAASEKNSLALSDIPTDPRTSSDAALRVGYTMLRSK